MYFYFIVGASVSSLRFTYKKCQGINKVANLLLPEISLSDESLTALGLCTVLLGRITPEF